MNRLLLFISITFFCTCTVFAQQKMSHVNDDATIRHMMADQVTEWNKGNIEGFMKGYWHSDSLYSLARQARSMAIRPPWKDTRPGILMLITWVRWLWI